MCDYSLAGIPNRLAVEGEQLVVHRFPASMGLAPCPPLAADSEGWRSAFRTDADHDSEVMPISVPN